jgi:lysophospholipase L1-like esterase
MKAMTRYETRTTSLQCLNRRAGWIAGLLIMLAFSLGNAFAAETHWVTTWACGQQLTEPRNLPPVPLANSTLRQFVRNSIAGRTIRVRFSNIYGTSPVTLNAAHVALAAGAGSAGSGEIAPATDKALTFNGTPGTVIPPGEQVYSDELAFNLPALTNVAISIFYGDISATIVNGHPSSRTTSFIIASNAVSAASLPTAIKTEHWFTVTGIEVQAGNSARTVVVLGDSIADGRGSTTDGNNRWPDILTGRLSSNAATADVGVANMGIGGNAIFGGLGPAGVKRFDRDVLGQSGVRYLIVVEGVNDIGSGRSSMATATNLINAYREFAAKAKAQNVRVYGATITPFGGNGYFSDLHEAERQLVNAWIRTNSVFDGCIDFDAAVRDPANPTKFLPAYHPGLNANDWLHMNPAGYQAMGNAIDLNLFAR